MMKNTECILFYVKYPEQGKVKTRLAKGLGDERAVELYKRFIQDLDEMLSDIPQQVCVCYAPDKA
ncbi:MAG: glycosyltransferase, partial [bacterium]|nr:glycosyltransferase [bacterium]